MKRYIRSTSIVDASPQQAKQLLVDSLADIGVSYFAYGHRPTVSTRGCILLQFLIADSDCPVCNNSDIAPGLYEGTLNFQGLQDAGLISADFKHLQRHQLRDDLFEFLNEQLRPAGWCVYDPYGMCGKHMFPDSGWVSGSDKDLCMRICACPIEVADAERRLYQELCK